MAGLGPDTRWLWPDGQVADLLATLVIFGFSRFYSNSSFYDACWSVVPPLLVGYWWASAGPDVSQTRAWLLSILVVVWAVRLTGNWVYAFPGLHHEDWRYPASREAAPGYASALACGGFEARCAHTSTSVGISLCWGLNWRGGLVALGLEPA